MITKTNTHLQFDVTGEHGNMGIPPKSTLNQNLEKMLSIHKCHLIHPIFSKLCMQLGSLTAVTYTDCQNEWTTMKIAMNIFSFLLRWILHRFSTSPQLPDYNDSWTHLNQTFFQTNMFAESKLQPMISNSMMLNPLRKWYNMFESGQYVHTIQVKHNMALHAAYPWQGGPWVTGP